jgi:hypothetical protein
MSRQGKLRKVLTRTAYGLGFALLMAIGLELMFRAVAFDPFYYWEYRFQYISPNSLENRSEGVWTYRPNTAIREVSVYGLPQLISTQPTLAIEFDCPMRSNNLGLLQDNDIAPGTPVTLVLGDSFTSGQGGCPWFHKLQARRPQDRLLNAGLFGTGVDQWWRLLEYLRKQGVVVERVLMISISNDFKRRIWNWTPVDLDCIDRNVCAVEWRYSWQGVRTEETADELLARTRERYARRFSKYNAVSMWFFSLLNHSLFLKFLHISVENVVNLVKSVGVLPQAESSLDKFRTSGVPVKVLMVTQRNETGLLGNEGDASAAEASLKAHGLAYEWCRLDHGDYLQIDGHPTAAGYDKLMACADRALNTK